MSFLATKSRTFLHRTAGRCLLSRAYSVTPILGATPTVDVDHFAHGWEFVEDIEDFKKHGYNTIQTFNKISPVGLSVFPKDRYTVSPAGESSEPANALLLRSHKLKVEEVDVSVRAIARCGAGTNNIPVEEMTELGIPVFNTPGYVRKTRRCTVSRTTHCLSVWLTFLFASFSFP